MMSLHLLYVTYGHSLRSYFNPTHHLFLNLTTLFCCQNLPVGGAILENTPVDHIREQEQTKCLSLFDFSHINSFEPPEYNMYIICQLASYCQHSLPLVWTGALLYQTCQHAMLSLVYILFVIMKCQFDTLFFSCSLLYLNKNVSF